MKSRILILGVFAALVSGCAAASALGRGAAKTPEEAYQRAVDDLADGLYPEAISGFADVKTKFPYSKLAALADLRTADTYYEQGKFLEAIDAYRQFMKLHPNHAEAPYAMWRIAESYREQIPEDWWFLPPASEKDQGNTRLAISAYRDMIDRYPTSEHAQKSRDKLAECRKKLAEHELYVAHFYWKRGKYPASAARAEGLVREYGGLGLDPEALLLAARARKLAGQLAEARADAEKLVTQFPQASEAAGAKDLLAELPAPAPAPTGG